MIVKYSTALTRALFVLAASAGAAPAADLPYMKPSFAFEAPPPAFTWTGLYGGLNAGGAVGEGVGAGAYADKSPSGVVGGGQLGFNYQLSPRFVIGAENDFQASSLKARDDSPYHRDATLPWFGTARGRVGFALTEPRLLIYGTGGMAFGEPKIAGDGKLRIGWTAGGGVEWAFARKWSAKLEYLYTDLYRDLRKDVDRHARFHTIRVGVNYHFDLFSQP
ncbi:outer membrane immunogenic protein [Methylosinus sp. sav-2]|uniref:outer membrane protein n=1 Tax=Methylosinus sp. sav-2 TaxID=2485168 RepID=UPI00047D5A87|nr:outer membrane protein [Methylosinus sp. sav-2]TDX65962.1 outer membrane immunogenic protein [Methylosinus sp. sav-2]